MQAYLNQRPKLKDIPVEDDNGPPIPKKQVEKAMKEMENSAKQLERMAFLPKC